MKKKSKEIEFPECWEELYPCEWVYLLKLRHKLINQEGISLADIKREWCRFVLKNRGIRSRETVDYYLLIYNLALTLDWMWSESEDGTTVGITFTSTQNLLPEWKNLKGPLSHGSDLTFAEFRTAVTMMNRYVESQDLNMLRALCGILYRRPGKKVGKKDFDGRYREEFNQARIGFYADRVRMMPVHILFGIYAWFAYFCNYLMTGTFIIDNEEISFAPLFRRSSGDQHSEQNLGMNGILFSVAETGIFGNVDKTDDTLLIRLMLKLLDDYQKAKAMTKKQ